MKVRESGMPEEAMWSGFFDPAHVLEVLGLTPETRDAVDLGCGYGTFSIPAAQHISGTLFAFDIDPLMVEATRAYAARTGVENVVVAERDFVAAGSGLPDGSVDYVMLFNIIHAEDPHELFRESRRILHAGGKLAVVHWNYDPDTPRGPPMAIRPRPSDCRRWIEESAFEIETGMVNLPPYHYGFLARTKL